MINSNRDAPWAKHYDRYQNLLERVEDRSEAVNHAKQSRQAATTIFGQHGRVLIVAADHAARGALRAGDRPFAMADRRELLARLCHALARPEVNGVLGSPDVLEELLLMGALENKTVFGSMNRGGLAGTVFELDDRFTASTPEALHSSRFDGGKMLIRIDPDDPATVRTLEACAHAIDGLAAHGLMAMVEPFIAHRKDGRVVNELTTDAMVRAVGVAASLGSSSARTWLKVPVVPEMERVLAASSLPALILGGEVRSDPDVAYSEWEKVLSLPTAHGFVLGRTILFPSDDNVDAALDTVIGIL